MKQIPGDPLSNDFTYDLNIPEKDELINRIKTEEIENKKGEVFGLNLSSFMCLDSVCLNPKNFNIIKENSKDKLEEWEEEGTMVYAAGNMGGILNLIFWSVNSQNVS